MSSAKWKLKQPWDSATYRLEQSKLRTLTTPSTSRVRGGWGNRSRPHWGRMRPAANLQKTWHFIFSFKSCLFVCLSVYWGPVRSCLQCVYVGQRTTLSFHYRGSTDCTEVISLVLLCRLSHFLDFNNLLNIKYTLPPDRVVWFGDSYQNSFES